jgi:hypothetical protein
MATKTREPRAVNCLMAIGEVLLPHVRVTALAMARSELRETAESLRCAQSWSRMATDPATNG